MCFDFNDFIGFIVDFCRFASGFMVGCESMLFRFQKDVSLVCAC